MSTYSELVKRLDAAQSEVHKRLKEIEASVRAGESFREETKAQLAGWTGAVQDLTKQLQEVMVKSGRVIPGGPASSRLSDLVFDSKAWKAKMEHRSPESMPIEIEGGFGPWMGARKDLVSTLSDPSGGFPVDQDRITAISPVRFRELRIRDLFDARATNRDTVEYVKETRWNQLSTTITGALTGGASTTADVVNINGVKPGSEMTLDPGGVNEEVVTVDSVTTPTADDPSGTITFTAAVANSHTVGTEIVSDEFNFTPETFLKPTGNVKFALESCAVKTLAHLLFTSRQVLEDEDMLRGHIDRRLMEGLLLEEERQFLYGADTSTELRGIISDADTQTYNQASGPASDEKQDAIRRAITLAELAFYPVDGVILHPTDWQDMELSKDAEDRYLLTTQVSEGAVGRLWRVPIVVTPAINQGQALLGAFSIGAQIQDRKRGEIRVSEHHKDFFGKNMLAILAEERLCFTLFRPESFVAVTFT